MWEGWATAWGPGSKALRPSSSKDQVSKSADPLIVMWPLDPDPLTWLVEAGLLDNLTGGNSNKHSNGSKNNVWV